MNDNVICLIDDLFCSDKIHRNTELEKSSELNYILSGIQNVQQTQLKHRPRASQRISLDIWKCRCNAGELFWVLNVTTTNWFLSLMFNNYGYDDDG